MATSAHTDDPHALQPDDWPGRGQVDYELAVEVLHQELSRVLPEPVTVAA